MNLKEFDAAIGNRFIGRRDSTTNQVTSFGSDRLIPLIQAFSIEPDLDIRRLLDGGVFKTIQADYYLSSPPTPGEPETECHA